MSRYTHITEEDFDSFAGAHKLVKRSRPNCENIYSQTWHGGKYLLTIYSSIVPGDGSRDVGEDAIRVVLKTEGIPVWSARVFRVEGWKKNLRERIEDARSIGRADSLNWQCPLCKKPLVMRNGRNGWFIGCIGFQNGCRYTSSVK